MTYDPNTERRDPPPATREVVHKSGGYAGWWVAGLVAIVAIVGLVFLFSNGGANDADLEMARDAGRAEAVVASAADSAQRAANQAAESSAAAADAVARNAEAAADNAAEATDNAADRVGM
ncbi:hypothetical protein [Phenylobacterium sp.]|uniref:hypothetical protein n=1 Tax=Phenylobacterium sp. TaxID=1871053 RepID=UPI002FDAF4F0